MPAVRDFDGCYKFSMAKLAWSRPSKTADIFQLRWESAAASNSLRRQWRPPEGRTERRAGGTLRLAINSAAAVLLMADRRSERGRLACGGHSQTREHPTSSSPHIGEELAEVRGWKRKPVINPGGPAPAKGEAGLAQNRQMAGDCGLLGNSRASCRWQTHTSGFAMRRFSLMRIGSAMALSSVMEPCRLFALPGNDSSAPGAAGAFRGKWSFRR